MPDFFAPAPSQGAFPPIPTLSADAGKRVGQERKKTAGNAPRRVVIDQPPHFGRIGMQATPPARKTAAEHGAARAVQVAHFERDQQMRLHGSRAVVRT